MIDLKKISTVAVVGASNNPEKIGHQIVQNLSDRGFKVFPVNLKEKEILSLPAFPNLMSVPVRPDLVDIVVPPKVALEIVKEAVQLEIKNIWLQPGAESSEILEFLKGHPGINVVSQSCIMMN